MPQEAVLRAAVIDIGTHTTKLLIAESRGTGITIIEQLRNILPIGKDTFANDRISQETINKSVAILEKYKEKLKEYSITDFKVIATTAVREAENRDIFVDTIQRRTGLNVEILTVGDIIYYFHAYLYHKLRNKYPLETKNLIIAELGSGSLDVSVMSKGYTLMNIGLPLGTLRIKNIIDRLDSTIKDNFIALGENIESIFNFLKRSLPDVKIDDVIIIDESYANYISQILPGKAFGDAFLTLDENDTALFCDKLKSLSIEKISNDFKIPAEIASIFPGYSHIMHNFVGLSLSKKVNILEITLAEAILANTVLDYEISQKYSKVNQLVSISKEIAKKYNTDLAHSEHVAVQCEILFSSLREILGLKKSDGLYLSLAALLHDIGTFISNRAHHKHSEYIISNLYLFRLNYEEVRTIACVARYHRKGNPAPSHLLYNSLSREKQILVQKLSSLLKMANSLDKTHNQKVVSLEVGSLKGQEVNLIAKTKGKFLLEKYEFNEKKALFEEISATKINLKIQEVES